MENTVEGKAAGGAATSEKSTWPFVIVLNILFSFCLSAVIGVMLPLMNGAPLTVEVFLLAIGWGTPVAAIFTTVVPVMKIGTIWAAKIGVPPTSHLSVLVRDIFLVTLLFLVLGLVLTGVLSGWDPSTYIARWLGVIPGTWPVAYVMSLIVEPGCFWLAGKLTGGVPREFQPAAPAEAAAL